MSVFGSFFWLWSIIGLLGLVMLYSFGAFMNMAGFLSPAGRFGRWVDRSPLIVKFAIVVGLLALVIYPSFVHRLWADATANQVRSAFGGLPTFTSAQPAPPSEQMNGLYDPTGTDGTYIIGWYGTAVPFSEVSDFYQSALTAKGWVRQPDPDPNSRTRSSLSAARIEFRDQAVRSAATYELLIAPLPAGSREVPAEISSAPTIYAVRLGVVDPRLTTQVAWFIDCLVRRAPTFPTCEAAGWSYLDQSAPRR